MGWVTQSNHIAPAVLLPVLNPCWDWERQFWLLKKCVKWEWTSFSIILLGVGRMEMGLHFVTSFKFPVLKKLGTSATFSNVTGSSSTWVICSFGFLKKLFTVDQNLCRSSLAAMSLFFYMQCTSFVYFFCDNASKLFGSTKVRCIFIFLYLVTWWGLSCTSLNTFWSIHWFM